MHFADYEFVFAGIKEKNGPNYDGFKGVLEVHRNGEQVALLKPEKRMYKVSRMPMTEAAIDAGITRDLYAALGEQLDNGAWRCGSTTSRSCAGSGSAASLWLLVACWRCSTSVTVSAVVRRRPRHEQKDLVVFNPLYRLFAGAVFLFKGLYSDPTKLESVMVGKEVPVFTLQDIYDLKKAARSQYPDWSPHAAQRLGYLVSDLLWRAHLPQTAGRAGHSHHRHELQG